VVDTGDAGVRTTNFVYDYDFGPWIKDRIKSQTVSTAGGGSFTVSAEHDNDTGFKISETRYGISTSLDPTPEGNVWKIHDGHNHITEFSYTWGVVQNTSRPEGDTTFRSINQDGTVASETVDPDGPGTRPALTTSFDYDSLGRLRWVKPAKGHWFETRYDDAGGQWVEHRRQGRWTKYSLDGFGRLVGSENSVGVRTSRTYDLFGRKTYESQPFAAGVAEDGSFFEFDALDRLGKVTHSGSGVLAEYAYGPGLDATITEYTSGGETRVVSQEWAAFGDPSDARLLSVTDGEGETFSYAYDTIGNLTQVSQPGGTSRSWKYYAGTALVEWEEHPESGRTSYTYDAGRLASKTDARQREFDYGYDANDRLTNITPVDLGAAHAVTMAYDTFDNRTVLENGFVKSSFEYDDANRLYKRRDEVKSSVVAERLDVDTKYWYDDWDNVTDMQYPSGHSAFYGHDSEGRITLVKLDGAIIGEVLAHHPSGAIKTLKYGNGLTEEFGYDDRHRLKTWTGGPLDLTYGYDRQGNVQSISSVAKPSVNQTFTYDHVDRLRQVFGFGATDYTYDALGNRKFKNGQGIGHEYNLQTMRLSKITGGFGSEFGDYAHDAVGNLESAPTASYTYTPFNMLETATINLAAGGTRVTRYQYDGDGMRVRRGETGAGSRDYFVHGAGGNLLSEFTHEATAEAPAWRRDYIYLGSRLLSSLSAPSASAAPSASVSLSAATQTVVEGTPNLTVNVVLALPAGASLTTAATVTVAAANGRAVADQDFSATSATVEFPIGSEGNAVKTVSVPIAQDGLDEPAETFTVTLSAPVNASLSGNTTQTVTITDDDDTPQSGDFTGDGKADLLWQSDLTGELIVWFMNGLTEIDRTYLIPNSVSDTNWKIVGRGDFTGDGKPDLVWQHTDGRIIMWPMNGYQLSGAAVWISDTTSLADWRVRAAGDANADASADLYLQNRVTGETAVWFMNGTTLIDGVLSLTVADTGWQIVGAADYDGDGHTDLYWQHNDGRVAGWRMHGALRLAVDDVLPGTMTPPWRIRGVAQVDGDGHPDWYIQNSSDNKVGVWFLRWNAATSTLELLGGELIDPLPAASSLGQGQGYEWKVVGPR
jgi:YD repeat-containing protein